MRRPSFFQLLPLWAMAVLLLSGPLAAQDVEAEDAPEAEAPATASESLVRSVAFRSVNEMQLDVWIDGERAGLTPFRARLAPGRYLVTAGSEGLEPVISVVEVPEEIPEGSRQTTMLDDRILTTERFPLVFAHMARSFQEHPDNPHFILLAMLMTQEREDFDGLLEMLPAVHRDDPLLAVAEAAWVAESGDIEGALDLLDGAARYEPELAAVWRARARLALRGGDIDKAFADAGQAVALEPSNPQNFRTRARVYDAMENERAARYDREQATELEDAIDRRFQQLMRQRMQVH